MTVDLNFIKDITHQAIRSERVHAIDGELRENFFRWKSMDARNAIKNLSCCIVCL